MKLIKWNLVGEFLLTIFIPLLYLGNIYSIIKTPNTFKPTYFIESIGIIISIIGLALWILSYIHLGKSFGVLPKKQKKVTRGLYKYTNHPMYIAIWLTFFGLSLILSSVWGLIYLNLIITPLLFIRANLEEKKLKNS